MAAIAPSIITGAFTAVGVLTAQYAITRRDDKGRKQARQDAQRELLASHQRDRVEALQDSAAALRIALYAYRDSTDEPTHDTKAVDEASTYLDVAAARVLDDDLRNKLNDWRLSAEAYAGLSEEIGAEVETAKWEALLKVVRSALMQNLAETPSLTLVQRANSRVKVRRK